MIISILTSTIKPNIWIQMFLISLYKISTGKHIYSYGNILLEYDYENMNLSLSIFNASWVAKTDLNIKECAGNANTLFISLSSPLVGGSPGWGGDMSDV